MENKSYKISKWMLSTAIAMVLLTTLTINRAQAYSLANVSGANIATSEINASDLVVLTNIARTQLSLPPLKTNSELAAAAMAKAVDMNENKYFDHFRPSDQKSPWSFMDENGYHWLSAGENLARGYQTSEQIVKAWLNSPSHRENLLNPKYQEIGIATTWGSKNGLPIVLTVQMFGVR